MLIHLAIVMQETAETLPYHVQMSGRNLIILMTYEPIIYAVLHLRFLRPISSSLESLSRSLWEKNYFALEVHDTEKLKIVQIYRNWDRKFRSRIHVLIYISNFARWAMTRVRALMPSLFLESKMVILHAFFLRCFATTDELLHVLSEVAACVELDQSELKIL